MSQIAARHTATQRVLVVTALAGAVGGGLLTAGVMSVVGRAETPEILRATVDSVDVDSGQVCLRRATGDTVDCYQAAVAGLTAGQSIDYALTTARTDPSQDGSGTQQVITWARPVSR